MKNIITYLTGLVFAFSLTSCEKSITFYQDDQQFILADSALQTPQDVQKLLNSVYDVEANFLGGQLQNLAELLADNNDDPTGRNDDYTQVYNRRTDFFNGTISGVYRDAYIAIFRANVLLSKVDEVPGVSTEFVNQVKAEARFIRALNHFMVVRLFAQPYGFTGNNQHAGITLRLEPSQTPLPRNTVAQVYDAIIADLQFAEQNLAETNSVYATKWSAVALLAKVYLEMGQFNNALAKANEIINSGRFQLDNLNRFEYGGSTENIFYVVSTPAINDRRGGAFSGNYRTDVPTAPVMRTTKAFYDLATVDTTDQRSKWFTILFPGESNQAYGVSKFNFEFLDVPVLHYTEIKLIKAECLFETGDQTGALAELNDLRLRANAPLYGSLTGNDLFNAIHFERRLEMCFEGERVYQLKRLGVRGLIQTIRNAPWNCNGMAIQFPNSEGTGGGFQFNPEGGCN